MVVARGEAVDETHRRSDHQMIASAGLGVVSVATVMAFVWYICTSSRIGEYTHSDTWCMWSDTSVSYLPSSSTGYTFLFFSLSSRRARE
jgi:hypothetical protein